MTTPEPMAERARAALIDVLDDAGDARAARLLRDGSDDIIWSDHAQQAMLTFATREVEAAVARSAAIADELGHHDIAILIREALR